MEPRAFFEKVRRAHSRAVERAGSTEVSIDLAGRRVFISFASPALYDRFMPALMHARCEAGPDRENLRLLVWDSDSTGVAAPVPPWRPSDYRQKGRIHGFNRDGIHTGYELGANVLSMFDDVSRVGIYWTPDGGLLPHYHIVSPFLTVLQWWAESQGLTLIHAGAVGTAEGGVLLAGPGGSGKSTTALACAGWSRLRYVSDDYCLLETGDSMRAHALFNSGKLDDYSLNLLPFLKPMAASETSGGGKAVFFLAESMPDALATSLPIKAILLPNPSGSDSTAYRPASPAEALRALAPSTIFQLTGSGRRSFAEIALLVRRIPSFHLELSRHMRDVPEAVMSILQDLA